MLEDPLKCAYNANDDVVEMFPEPDIPSKSMKKARVQTRCINNYLRNHTQNAVVYRLRSVSFSIERH